MLTPTQRQRPLLACMLSLACALTPATAQTTDPAKPTDPDAAVPETRYQPAHVPRAAGAPTTTPDRTWQENNRIVAGQASHGAHAQHGKPASTPAPDPHADHHDHHAPPEKKEHH